MKKIFSTNSQFLTNFVLPTTVFVVALTLFETRPMTSSNAEKSIGALASCETERKDTVCFDSRFTTSCSQIPIVQANWECFVIADIKSTPLPDCDTLPEPAGTGLLCGTRARVTPNHSCTAHWMCVPWL
jgi:hypothetical protein